MTYRPVILCILDGWGIGDNHHKHNAIAGANPKTYNSLLKNFPHSKLQASEQSVGLPSLQMGNSEVGHMTIGGGRVFQQDLMRISNALDNDIDNIMSLKNNMPKTKICHILGLVSDGGVHSHISHVLSLAKYYVNNQIQVWLHVITDGRDTLPKSAKTYIRQLEKFCSNHPLAKIATISGRYYAMDRDKRFERTEKAYNAIISAEGTKFTDIQDVIEQSYNNQIFDEFIEPSVSIEYKGIAEGDLLVCTNFRSDRMRQIVEAFSLPDFNSFKRHKVIHNTSKILTMTQYSDMFDSIIEVIFKPETHDNLLTDVINKHNMSQLRVAETEKYAHITFFFDGGQENAKKLEKRVLVPSPKVEQYNLKPEMSAYEVTDVILSGFQEKKYDFCLVNYANADMVGHTGDYDASVKAVKAIDNCLEKLYQLSKNMDLTLLITADHGNVEFMFDDDKESKHTAHTINPVPFILVDHHLKAAKVKDGKLSDIAPTILDLLGLDKPAEMTGNSVLKR